MTKQKRDLVDSSLGKSDMAEWEKFIPFLEQRDRVQNEAQQRLIQAQTEGAKNLAEVATTLSKIHGGQQDAHDNLSLLERCVNDHDNVLQRHIDAVKQHNKERDKEQERIESSLQEIKRILEATNKSIDQFTQKQLRLGKILVTVGGVATALATLFGIILTLLLK